MNDIIYTEEFKEIITFYLFECPVRDVSHRGKTFKDIGWHGSSRFQMLERLLKSCTNIEEKYWITCDTSDVEKNTKNIQANLFMVCNSDRGKAQSVIYSIRCAFAHGSFDVKKIQGRNLYYFENHFRGKLRAKIVIEESALIEWIKIIKTNPEFLTKKARRKT